MTTLVSPLDYNKAARISDASISMSSTTNRSGDIAGKQIMHLTEEAKHCITCVTSQVTDLDEACTLSPIERDSQTIHGADGLNNLAFSILGVNF